MTRPKEENFERELPAGYQEVFAIDAKSKKTGILLNLAALAIGGAVFGVCWYIIRPAGYLMNYSIAREMILLAVMIGYLVLHELTHGVAYKLLTGEKLKFGVSLTAAWCGVPEIYVYRKTALISLLAPFTVFNIVFILLTVFLTDPWYKLDAAIMLSLHVGGCAGDLYDTFLYLFRFRDPKTLMRDTGPKQSFYVKMKNEE